MATVLGLLAVVWHFRQPSVVAGRLQEQLAIVPEGQVEQHFQRIAELGDAGVPVLVAALAADRATVREAARRGLLDVVNQWELSTPSKTAPRLADLAHRLANSAAQLPTDDRRFAADLATRLVQWPAERGSAGVASLPRDGLLADCQTVLSAVATRSVPESLTDQVAQNPQAIASPAAFSDPALSLAQAVSIPGGGLPVETTPMPAGPGFVAPRSVLRTGVAVGEPNRLPDPIVGQSLGPEDPQRGEERSSGPPEANKPRRLPLPRGDLVDPASGELAPQRVTPALAPNPADATAWKQMPPRDVMRRLHVSDPHVVAAAQLELEHRGITGPLVELARQAGDPDPEVRRKLAESLPSMRGVDAKPWLLELSYDDDPRVRATAVTLMATSGDLEMVHRLEQIARDDPDDYTRQQAERAIAPRSR